MLCSAIAKNWNWGILTKNLVAFKNKMGFRMENFNIFGVQGKIWFLVGGKEVSCFLQ